MQSQDHCYIVKPFIILTIHSQSTEFYFSLQLDTRDSTFSDSSLGGGDFDHIEKVKS